MRFALMVLILLGVAACHPTRGGSMHVDGVGGASWGGGHHKHHAKGCPPGLAKQGRC